MTHPSIRDTVRCTNHHMILIGVTNLKLIATDLDGTLLNEMGKVSKENSAAIQHALNQEIEVVVATGRAYGTAAKELKKSRIKSSNYWTKWCGTLHNG